MILKYDNGFLNGCIAYIHGQCGSRPTDIPLPEWLELISRQSYLSVPYKSDGNVVYVHMRDKGFTTILDIDVDRTYYIKHREMTLLHTTDNHKYAVPGDQSSLRGKMHLQYTTTALYIDVNDLSPVQEYLCL